MMTSTGLRRILDELSDDEGWPEVPKTSGTFESLAIRELRAAERMDYLAARRALAAKALRTGKNVKAAELLELGRSVKKMSEDFRKLWLLRNKTSRLQDNLKLFKRVERESYRLAGKKKRL
jgi:hypothetical protein